MEAPEESMTTVDSQSGTRQLPSQIRANLEEFYDFFPHDLPLVLPLVRQGH